MNEENTQPEVPNFEGEEMKMPENVTAQEVSVEKSSSIINAPLLFTLIVLLLVILSGMYYWFGTLEQPQEVAPVVERPTAEENNEPESTTAEAQTETILTTSPSDEITAIEADIESTELESLDAELNAIDAEIEAALE